jgi:hypothetical protein
VYQGPDATPEAALGQRHACSKSPASIIPTTSALFVHSETLIVMLLSCFDSCRSVRQLFGVDGQHKPAA